MLKGEEPGTARKNPLNLFMRSTSTAAEGVLKAYRDDVLEKEQAMLLTEEQSDLHVLGLSDPVSLFDKPHWQRLSEEQQQDVMELYKKRDAFCSTQEKACESLGLNNPITDSL